MGADLFTIQTFTEVETADWASFVDACPEAWLNHRPEVIRGSAQTCSFALSRQGRIVAVCVVARVRDHLGWVFDGPGVAVGEGEDAERVHLAVADELRLRAKQWGCIAVRFDLPLLAPAHAERSHARSALAAMGFSSGFRPSNRIDFAHSFHSIIDLRRDMEQVLKGFSRGNRNSVSRALKRNFTLTFTHGTPPAEAEWRDFVAINRLTFARSGLVGFSPDHLDHLRQLVAAGFLVLMNIADDGECIASELLEVYKGGVNCLAGGSTDAARQFGITPFSMYSAMRWAKAQGCHHFDLGSSFPTLSGTRHGSIGESKRRFGGVRQGDLSGEWILAPNAHFLRILAPRLAHQAVADWLSPRLLKGLRGLRGWLKGGRMQPQSAGERESVEAAPAPSPRPVPPRPDLVGAAADEGGAARHIG